MSEKRCQHQLTDERDKCKHDLHWGTTCEDCILSCPSCWDGYSSASGFGPRPFDPHALAMALQLADLIEANFGIGGSGCRCATCQTVKWLRDEVQRELERQP